MTPFCSGFYIGGFSEEVCTLFSTPPLGFSVFFCLTPYPQGGMSNEEIYPLTHISRCLADAGL